MMTVSEWYNINKLDLDAFDLKVMTEYLVSKGLKMPQDWADNNDKTKADFEKIKDSLSKSDTK